MRGWSGRERVVKRYTVLRVDECLWHEMEVHTLTPFPVPARVAETIGQAWASKFPEEIVMLVLA